MNENTKRFEALLTETGRRGVGNVLKELAAVGLLNAKIFAEKELDESVVKSYFTTAADGKRYNVIY